MKSWTTALPDWESRIVEGGSLIPCEPLFPDEAKDALDVFKALRIVDAPGRPTFGEAGDQWIFDFVAAIFGAYDAESGNRLINQFFLCVSKKNGKSTIAAGIMLTALILNWRQSNELIIVAPTIKAANNSFKPAADMIRADPELDASAEGFLHVTDHQRTIKHLKTGATLQILAADTGTVAGNKAAFVLVDELWEFGSKPKADAMMREAAGGLVARPEGFLISITTQSDAPPAGVFKDKLDYARNVRDGKINDPKFLPLIYEFPQSMIDSEAYLHPENFYITNPYLGYTDWGREWIADELVKEREKGPETRNVFLAKHLNVEIGMNLRSNRWAGADFWAAKADDTIDLESILDRSEVVVVGIDGGGLDDLFGLTVLGREKGSRDWLSWSHAWCHKGVLERRKSIASKLNDFKRDGLLTIVDDELKDISEIVEIISDIKARGLLASVAVDPAGLGEMIEALAEIDVTQEAGNLVGAPQGYAMMNAIKTAERKLANGTLKHAPSALMDWCVSNLKIEPTATAIRATKQNAGDAKIDPVMSLFDAVTVMSRNPEAPGAGMDDYFKSLAGAA
ncbi:terminase large subunit [Agrobacterium sp. FDAARGOS_525]|uniref:terminase large subunit n=1 Tax=Agrobacterium sp. FDAARGOS_525 TaxID=2420311 RepID=UPI000F65B21A|nr:terminase large subunit [Agrobacterium sp. FDAARGOS_525]RSC31241.1 terminase large subunit [Agrobacterium sp. FDAARGOS_525]